MFCTSSEPIHAHFEYLNIETEPKLFFYFRFYQRYQELLLRLVSSPVINLFIVTSISEPEDLILLHVYNLFHFYQEILNVLNYYQF